MKGQRNAKVEEVKYFRKSTQTALPILLLGPVSVRVHQAAALQHADMQRDGLRTSTWLQEWHQSTAARSTSPVHTLLSTVFTQHTDAHSDSVMTACLVPSHNLTVYFAGLELCNLSGSVHGTPLAGGASETQTESMSAASKHWFTLQNQIRELCTCSSAMAFVTSIAWFSCCSTKEGLRIELWYILAGLSTKAFWAR